MKNLFQKRNTEQDRGFTFLELIFVIAIFGIMASIVLFRFNDFGTKTALDNLAQDVALRIVEAQKAAISGATVLNLTGIDAAHAPSYGVYFSDDASTDTDNHQFTYFADLDHNGLYAYDPVCPSTPTVGQECLSVTTITSGDFVSNICYDSATSGFTCVDHGSAHIVFTRPFPDAAMKVLLVSGAAMAGITTIFPADTTYIEISSGVDTTLQKTIVVTSLGEVHVYNGPVCAAHTPSTCLLP